MRIYNNTVIIVATCLALFISCKNHDATQEDLGYTYFPITEGTYSIFSVVDTVFQGINSGIVVDTSSSYFIKEEIHAPITVDDETRYEVYRYYSSDVNTWKDQPDSVWTEFNTNGKIVRVENNIRYVKLIFPLTVGATWNGNIANTNPQLAQTYTMTNVFRPFSYGSYNYPKTVSVIQYSDSSAIASDFSIEVYADNIGLVYKEIKNYKHQDNSMITPLVSGGLHYTQKLLSYGNYQ
jgi:hypothetical protein